MDQTPSSGDCEVAAERRLPETGILQFDTEIAAPDSRLRTPTGTGASSSNKSANGSRASRRMGLWEGRKVVLRLPLVGGHNYRSHGQKTFLISKELRGVAAFCAFFGRGSPFGVTRPKRQN